MKYEHKDKKQRKATGVNAKKLNTLIQEAFIAGNMVRYKTLIKRAEKRGYIIEGETK